MARGQAVVQDKTFDAQRIRSDFPVLGQQVRGKPLVYLDNAATAQKPRKVIQALANYYSADNANIHRGIHYLSERSTAAYEEARRKIQRFINAQSPQEIVYVRGTTEAINLVAQSYGRPRFKKGGEILISGMEHHSNIVPWQILCAQTGAKLKIIPVDDRGELQLDQYERMLNDRTQFVAIVYVSNSIGTINPVKEMIRKAHERGVPVLVDAAQAVPHLAVDVRDLGCDFLAFSGHKLFGPTGTGILYARKQLLEEMPPYQGGGDMISSVTFEKTQYNTIPYKFEAGTPHIAGGIGLGAAVDYIEEIGIDRITEYEKGLLTLATQALSSVKGLRIIGTAAEKASIVSFVLDGIHAHDVGTILDQDGIAIRAGHHCTMPLMDRFGVPATARASFAFYNTPQEIDCLVKSVRKAIQVFS